MKRLFGLFAFLFFAFCSAFYYGRMEHSSSKSSFKPTVYPVLNRPFVIVVIGNNSGPFLEKSVQSVLSQNYENFRIIYIDDGSSDGSFELARDLMVETKIQSVFARNEENLGSLQSLVNAVADCKDDEIVVVLDGNDWLAHEWVLARLNQYYANSDLWITYGRYCQYPQYVLGAVPRPSRDKPFSPLQLNTFYAGLFKQIGMFDFADLRGSEEMAYMIPMLEMAGGHSSFIPEVLYVINGIVPKSEIKDQIATSEKLIRSMAAYEPLMKWSSSE